MDDGSGETAGRVATNRTDAGDERADADDGGGSVVLLTGGTRGIGREAVKKLAARGATVLFTGRDATAGREVEAAVHRETGREATFLRADFADLDAVAELAATVRERTDRLDALVANAGTFQPTRRTSADGYELTFAVNHLAHFLLVHELADLLVAGRARVVVVSSAVQERGDLDFADLQFERGYDKWDAYARSKLANVAFALGLADRLAGTGVTANALHPGVVPATRLSRESSLPMRLALRAMTMVPGLTASPSQAADAVVALACSSEFAGVTGRYFDRTEPEHPNPAALDPATRERLWTVSADLVGVDPDLPVDAAEVTE